MSFDKAEYWKNRKAGKRGQGEVPPQKLSEADEKALAKRQKSGEHFIQDGPMHFFGNRQQYRKIMKPWRTKKEGKA
jgi:hypothetical protein